MDVLVGCGHFYQRGTFGRAHVVNSEVVLDY